MFNIEQFIRDTLNDFIINYDCSDSIGWKNPLVAYAQADDLLFPRLKDLVSPIHALPQDFMAEARTVITCFLPFRDEVIAGNKKGKFSSQ